MTRPNTFMVEDLGLPAIVLPTELATKRWRVHCACGYVATSRSEQAARVYAVEHVEYAHPPHPPR